ncbi:MAG TPA: redoxin domain-containing protein [Polyangiaceae bacterium]|nr:redoxin domain-containing protein [Polyangiaceae bacterium]
MTIERRSFISGLGLVCVAAGCGSGEPAPNEPGAKQPGFQLQDFQPQSERFGETYGLEEFRGSVLLLPLYAGWCSTCIGCADILNDVYKQWQSEGLNVRVAAINPINALHNQKFLVEVCDFPLLQDTEQQNAWDALLGTKDDTYVYTPDGVLGTFIDFQADLSQMIVSEAGKAMLRKAIVDAGG